MTSEDRQSMVDFLSKHQKPGSKLLSLSEVDPDARVKIVVCAPGTDQQMLARATVLSSGNEGVLCKCGPGYTEFPLDYPCLWKIEATTPDEEI